MQDAALSTSQAHQKATAIIAKVATAKQAAFHIHDNPEKVSDLFYIGAVLEEMEEEMDLIIFHLSEAMKQPGA